MAGEARNGASFYNLSPNDAHCVAQGKDEALLCSLSNFDGFFVSRKYKSPKPFVFAVKSIDNISLFEDKADYVHVFSCSAKEGEQWMRNILVARVGNSMTPTYALLNLGSPELRIAQRTN